MTIIGEAFVRVSPDTKGFGPAAEKGVESGLGGAVKKIGLALGGAFALSEGVSQIKDAVTAARESNKIAAQTTAVIKSTGGAAKVSGKEISNLAESIAQKTGVDDEAIQKAENLLLTFTKVRNETGKGNDVFNQATQTLVDMGAALGTDAASSAIQLGKALNDPVKGVVALTRVGVTFTKEQKDQIKTLAESGKVVDAQKIILKELATEFGGSAAAQATAADRLKVTLGNLQEDLGNKLIPIIDKAATFIAERLPGALDKAGAFFGKIGHMAKIAGDVLRFNFGSDPDVTSDGWVGLLEKITINIRAFLEGLGLIPKATGPALDGVRNFGENVREVWRTVQEKVLPVVRKLVDFVKSNMTPVFIGIAAVLGGAFLLAIGAAVAAVAGFVIGIVEVLAPIALVVAAIAGAIIAFQKFPIVREIVGDVVSFIVVNFNRLRAFVEEVWPSIQEAITHVVNVIQITIEAFTSQVMKAWELFGDDILRVIGAVWSQVKLIVESAIGIISGIIRFALAIINGDWSKAWDALKDVVTTVFDLLAGTVKNAIDGIVGILGGLFDALRGVASDAFDFGVMLMENIINGIKSLSLKALRELTDFILKGIPDFIEDRIPGLDAFKKSIAEQPKTPPTPVGGSGSVRAAEVASAQGGVTIVNNTSAEPLHIAAEVAWKRAI